MFSKKTYLKIFYPICVILIFAFLAVARIIWPATSPPYSDLWQTISGLGDVEDNPIGFWFFQFSMLTVGVLLLPAIFYYHARLAKAKKFVTSIGTLLFFIGAIGFLLTGFVPQHTLANLFPEYADVYIIEKFHEITAIGGSGCIVFAAFFYGIVILKGKVPINRKLNIVIILMWWVPLIIGIACIGYGYIVYEELVDDAALALALGAPWFVSLGLWERVIFCIIIAYAGLIVTALPDRES